MSRDRIVAAIAIVLLQSCVEVFFSAEEPPAVEDTIAQDAVNEIVRREMEFSPSQREAIKRMHEYLSAPEPCHEHDPGFTPERIREMTVAVERARAAEKLEGPEPHD